MLHIAQTKKFCVLNAVWKGVLITQTWPARIWSSYAFLHLRLYVAVWKE